jgi:hypothetical protein
MIHKMPPLPSAPNAAKQAYRYVKAICYKFINFMRLKEWDSIYATDSDEYNYRPLNLISIILRKM